MKKILILSGSPRVHGNSNILCDEFAQGAKESGNEVEKILITKKKVNGCLGCNACMRTGGECVQKDDMNEIRDKMLAADIIVLASPIYYYTVTSQLKAVMDRCYSFGHDKLKGKTFYYLISCAAPTEDYAQNILATLNGFVSCCPEAKNGGYIIATDTHNAGDIESSIKQKAFEMGRNI